jgi:hypothetical protein
VALITAVSDVVVVLVKVPVNVPLLSVSVPL